MTKEKSSPAFARPVFARLVTNAVDIKARHLPRGLHYSWFCSTSHWGSSIRAILSRTSIMTMRPERWVLFAKYFPAEESYLSSQVERKSMSGRSVWNNSNSFSPIFRKIGTSFINRDQCRLTIFRICAANCVSLINRMRNICWHEVNSATLLTSYIWEDARSKMFSFWIPLITSN